MAKVSAREKLFPELLDELFQVSQILQAVFEVGRSHFRELSLQAVEKDVHLQFDEGARLAQFHAHTQVLTERSDAMGMHLRVRAHPQILAQLLK